MLMVVEFVELMLLAVQPNKSSSSLLPTQAEISSIEFFQSVFLLLC